MDNYFADLLSNMDGYYDLEFDSSSQESFDSDTSDHKQSILLEPEINNQSERVMKLAVMFKKTFSEVKKKVKPISPKDDADLEIEHCDGRSRTLGERSMNV
ncbi:hypothetical protein YC2023_097977 [Brassica napus]